MRKPLMMVFVLLLATSGCRWGIYTKQAQERCFPTDVRQMHKWLWGEDAIFDTPTCVDAAYHGHKPTCWREWQAPATVWRDEHCGPPVAAACNLNSGCPSTPSIVSPPVVLESVTTEAIQPNPAAVELEMPAEIEVSPGSPRELEQPAAVDPPEPLPSLEPQASQERLPQTPPAQPSAVRQAAASQPAAKLAKPLLVVKKQATDDLYDSWRAAPESSSAPRDRGAKRLPTQTRVSKPRALPKIQTPAHKVKPSAVLASAQAEQRSKPDAFQPLFLQSRHNDTTTQVSQPSKPRKPQPRRLPMGFEIAP